MGASNHHQECWQVQSCQQFDCFETKWSFEWLAFHKWKIKLQIRNQEINLRFYLDPWGSMLFLIGIHIFASGRTKKEKKMDHPTASSVMNL